MQVRRLVYLLTLSGPSPGAPPPPRMQVPTHLVVHCSALADLGCLIRSCFPSPPAHQLLVMHKRLRSKSARSHERNARTHRRAWAGRWRRCPPEAPASRGWPREPAPPRPAPPAPTSTGSGGWPLAAWPRLSGDSETVAQDKSARTVASRNPGKSCGHPDQPRWLTSDDTADTTSACDQ